MGSEDPVLRQQLGNLVRDFITLFYSCTEFFSNLFMVDIEMFPFYGMNKWNFYFKKMLIYLFYHILKIFMKIIII